MGGNIWQDNIRIPASEYHALVPQVLERVGVMIPLVASFSVIPSYHTKESFGDMDLVIGCSKPESIKRDLERVFEITSKQVSSHGNIVSFQWHQFQIDLIFSGAEDFVSTLVYFSWNDIGNLMGRLYHKTGFKYGHRGLTYVVRDGDWQFDEILVSKDRSKILEFVGYGPERFNQGFDTLDEIYSYVISSPYFNRSMFLSENITHIARVRNRKRPVYATFLEWLEQGGREVPDYPWEVFDRDDNRKSWLERAFVSFPGFYSEYEGVISAFERQKEFKRKFNGSLVREVTGLEGQELGRLMQILRLPQHCPGVTLQEWVLAHTQSQVLDWIEYVFESQWEEKQR